MMVRCFSWVSEGWGGRGGRPGGGLTFSNASAVRWRRSGKAGSASALLGSVSDRGIAAAASAAVGIFHNGTAVAMAPSFGT